MSSFIILSYGRSGSVLLAHNIGRNLKFLPVYLKTPEELTYPVIHSHLFLTENQTGNYTRVFNLRQDPIETVLSFAIANKNNQYHKFATETAKVTETFCVDLEQVRKLCNGLVTWHNYYASTLTSNDCVVVYEQFIAKLANAVYDKIYPDKDNIILNYHEVYEECEKYKDAMLNSIAPFLQHVNGQSIDHLLN